MHSLQEDSEVFSPDPVNSTVNPGLGAAIRAVLYSDSERNQRGFIRSLLNSTLILLTLEPIRNPKGEILNMDEEGFGYYAQNTKIPLVQLNDQTGQLLLPVFTESKFVHSIKGLNAYHGLAVPALQALEMFKVAGSDVFSLNPGSREHLDIHRDSLLALIKDLTEKGVLGEESSIRLD